MSEFLGFLRYSDIQSTEWTVDPDPEEQSDQDLHCNLLAIQSACFGCINVLQHHTSNFLNCSDFYCKTILQFIFYDNYSIFGGVHFPFFLYLSRTTTKPTK